ncbi:MAG: hypothetical protein AB7W59_03395, partial [Acidimicrobiia bacterium]
MVAPPWWLSLVLVLLAVPARPAGSASDRQGAAAGRAGAAVLAAAAATAVLTVVALAEAPLRTALQVTAPSVRLAAGVAVGVVALGRVLAVLTTRRHPPADDRPHDAAPDPTEGRARPLVAAVLRRLPGGPLRVEVAVAVWSLAADHGVALGVLAALLCAPLDAADAADAVRPGRTGRALPG